VKEIQEGLSDVQVQTSSKEQFFLLMTQKKILVLSCKTN
jgi:hypothetical protein